MFDYKTAQYTVYVKLSLYTGESIYLRTDSVESLIPVVEHREDLDATKVVTSSGTQYVVIGSPDAVLSQMNDASSQTTRLVS